MSNALVDNFLSFSGTMNDFERVLMASRLYGISLGLRGVFPVPKLMAERAFCCYLSFCVVVTCSLKMALRMSVATMFCS